MSISFNCSCGYHLRAPDESAGKRGKCKKCGAIVQVPTPTIETVPEELDPSLDDLARASATIPGEDGTVPFAMAPAANPAPVPRRVTTPFVSTSAPPRATRPAEALPMSTPVAGLRRHLYWVILLVLIPLAWSTLHISPDEQPVTSRLTQTIVAHPEIQQKLEALDDDATKAQLFALLPDDRLEGALLSEQTWTHWGFALASGVTFLIAALVLFPGGHARWTHLATVGLLTGTLGIVLLLAFQWIAFHMPLFRGRGVITLLLDFVWLIGQSYRMALGEHGFVLSFLGFTAGVGFCEEACKALPLLFRVRSQGFSSWRSAMLWGLISGIGFGVSEGITYSSDYYNGISGAEMYLVRFISCVGLHGIWTAAVGINIFRRQAHFQGMMSVPDWILQIAITATVPMILHGLYDTLLKQRYDAAALAVAIVSFGWLAYQIEMARRHFDRDDARAAGPVLA